jgi:hypothetical protein
MAQARRPAGGLEPRVTRRPGTLATLGAYGAPGALPRPGPVAIAHYISYMHNAAW